MSAARERIAYVLKMYPRFSETFILAEILELERRGRELRIVSLKKPDDGRFHEDLARVVAGVDYVPEHVQDAPVAFASAHLRAVRRHPGRYAAVLLLAARHVPHTWKALLRAPLVAEAVARAGCSRMHAHFASLPAVTAMLASVLAGLPFSFTAHAKDIFQERRSARLLRTLIRRADRVVTVSDFNVRTLAAFAGTSILPDRIVRIYNGVDLDAFAPATASSHGPDPEQAPLVLAVGRLVEKKGFGDLVSACALLLEARVRFRCLIVGKGPLEARLRGQIARAGLQGVVVLSGPRSRGQVAALLKHAAVLAVPCVVGSDGNRDGLPTVIPEAMAAGVPVVATRVTGIPEAVEDGLTGFLAEPGRPQELAEAISRVLSDPELARAMGAAGRARAEARFDLRRNVAELDEIVHGVDAHGGPDWAARLPVTQRVAR